MGAPLLNTWEVFPRSNLECSCFSQKIDDSSSSGTPRKSSKDPLGVPGPPEHFALKPRLLFMIRENLAMSRNVSKSGRQSNTLLSSCLKNFMECHRLKSHFKRDDFPVNLLWIGLTPQYHKDKEMAQNAKVSLSNNTGVPNSY